MAHLTTATAWHPACFPQAPCLGCVALAWRGPASRPALRGVSAPGESGQDFSQAVARVWDSYDVAVKEAQAGVMESAGRVLSGLVEVTALLPVSAVDLPGTALRLDGLATDLAKAARALREIIDDGR